VAPYPIKKREIDYWLSWGKVEVVEERKR